VLARVCCVFACQLQGKAVTCIFCRPDTRSVWTGHADGSVMLHKDGKWGAAQYKTQVGPAQRSFPDNAGGGASRAAASFHATKKLTA
jgi:hypothetical protein